MKSKSSHKEHKDTKKTVLEEAEAIVNGPRRQAYGSAKLSFERVAKVWSAVLDRHVTADQVAQCMIGLKLVRESNKTGRDNLVDMCGYIRLIEMINE